MKNNKSQSKISEHLKIIKDDSIEEDEEDTAVEEEILPESANILIMNETEFRTNVSNLNHEFQAF